MNRKEYYKDYYLKNKAKKLTAAKLRHKRINTSEFLAKRREYFKKYYQLNKEKVIARTSKNNIKAVREDLGVRIKSRLRTRIYIALKRNKKFFKLKDVLGCTLDELKIHLESKFKNGMSWDNYNRYGWHIDHIRPCSSFDMSDPEQQKICFHYINLQPLWAHENLAKYNKIL